MIAQIPTPTGYALTNWMLCAAAAMAILRLSFGFWRDIKGQPANESLKESADHLSGRIASLEASMQLRPTADSVKVSVDNLGHRVGSIEQLRVADDREASGQRARLYDEIKSVRHDMEVNINQARRDLTQHVEDVRHELSDDIKSLANKVGDTPAETVALLRNAGVIK